MMMVVMMVVMIYYDTACRAADGIRCCGTHLTSSSCCLRRVAGGYQS
jgi:hypothetical protein